MAKLPYPPNGSHTPEAIAQREVFWRDAIRRWKASGLDKTAFCRREGVSDASLHYWIRELRRRERSRRPARPPEGKPRKGNSARSFVPVRVVKSRPAAPKPVEVLVGGQVIRVLPEFDPETFRRIVQVLEGWPTLAETAEDPQC